MNFGTQWHNGIAAIIKMRSFTDKMFEIQNISSY